MQEERNAGAVSGFEPPPTIPAAGSPGETSAADRRGCWLGDLMNGCEIGCCALEGCAGCSTVLVLLAVVVFATGGSFLALVLR